MKAKTQLILISLLISCANPCAADIGIIKGSKSREMVDVDDYMKTHGSEFMSIDEILDKMPPKKIAAKKLNVKLIDGRNKVMTSYDFLIKIQNGKYDYAKFKNQKTPKIPMGSKVFYSE